MCRPNYSSWFEGYPVIVTEALNHYKVFAKDTCRKANVRLRFVEPDVSFSEPRFTVVQIGGAGS